MNERTTLRIVDTNLRALAIACNRITLFELYIFVGWDVPSELLYLPAENHHCLNPQNSMVWHETIFDSKTSLAITLDHIGELG